MENSMSSPKIFLIAYAGCVMLGFLLIPFIPVTYGTAGPGLICASSTVTVVVPPGSDVPPGSNVLSISSSNANSSTTETGVTWSAAGGTTHLTQPPEVWEICIGPAGSIIFHRAYVSVLFQLTGFGPRWWIS